MSDGEATAQADDLLPPIAAVIAGIEAVLALPPKTKLQAASVMHADARDEALWLRTYAALPGVMHTEALQRRTRKVEQRWRCEHLRGHYSSLAALRDALRIKAAGGDPEAPAVPLDEQIACVRREVGKRERFYPGWVSEGRMTQAAADRETAAMKAVLATLERLARGD